MKYFIAGLITLIFLFGTKCAKTRDKIPEVMTTDQFNSYVKETFNYLEEIDDSFSVICGIWEVDSMIGGWTNGMQKVKNDYYLSIDKKGICSVVVRDTVIAFGLLQDLKEINDNKHINCKYDSKFNIKEINLYNSYLKKGTTNWIPKFDWSLNIGSQDVLWVSVDIVDAPSYRHWRKRN